MTQFQQEAQDGMEVIEAIPRRTTKMLVATMENPVVIDGIVPRTSVEEQVETAITAFLEGKQVEALDASETARGRTLTTGETGILTDESGEVVIGKRDLSEELITYATIEEDGERRIALIFFDIDNARRLNIRLKDRATANGIISQIGNSVVRQISGLPTKVSEEQSLNTVLQNAVTQISSDLGELRISSEDLSADFKDKADENDTVAKILNGSVSMGAVVVGEKEIKALADELIGKCVEQADLPGAIKSELLARADQALRVAKGRDSILLDNGEKVTGEKSTVAICRITEDVKDPGKRTNAVTLLKKDGTEAEGIIEPVEVKKRVSVGYQSESGEHVPIGKIQGHVEDPGKEDEEFGVYKVENFKDLVGEFEDGAAVITFEIGFSALNALLGYAETDQIWKAMASELLNQLGEGTEFKIVKAGTVLVLVGPKDTSKEYADNLCRKSAETLLKNIKIFEDEQVTDFEQFLTAAGKRKIGATGFFFEHAIVGLDENEKLKIKEYVSEREEIPPIGFGE